MWRGQDTKLEFNQRTAFLLELRFKHPDCMEHFVVLTNVYICTRYDIKNNPSYRLMLRNNSIQSVTYDRKSI